MVQRLILARHGESECSAAQVVNGDPRVECPLTDRGRQQACALGKQLRAVSIDACVATQFARTTETASLVVAGRGLEVEIEPLLNDPVVGDFESQPLASYLRWHEGARWDDLPPGGGESQLIAVERYLRGYERLVARPEATILAVAHAFPISVALSILDPSAPALRRRYELEVGYGRPHEVDAGDLAAALARLRRELEPHTQTTGRVQR